MAAKDFASGQMGDLARASGNYLSGFELRNVRQAREPSTCEFILSKKAAVFQNQTPKY
jgi:hypothetical protein